MKLFSGLLLFCNLRRMSEKQANKILCCLCTRLIAPNPINMCVHCIQNKFDITEGIEKEASLSFCPECERYLSPPNHWVSCELESKGLLQICLKKTKGLERLKLVDASFVWTEPHSKRVKIKLVVQKTLFSGVTLQQSVLVTFVVEKLQCDMCRKLYTNMTWSALVQLRQRAEHKKTFLYIEQLILRHEMHRHCTNIKERPEGLDFYFQQSNVAKKLAEFIASYCPVITKKAKRLISADNHSNIYNYKRTWSLEIASICKDDLCCLPKAFRGLLGGLGPLVLCYRVNKALHFIDPFTLQNSMLQCGHYFDNPFRPLLTASRLVQYMVLDIEPVRRRLKYKHRKFRLCDVQVCKIDSMDDVKYVISHLGHILKVGDTVLCYELSKINSNDTNFTRLKESNVPNLIIVKKKYNKRRRKKKKKKDDDDDGHVSEEEEEEKSRSTELKIKRLENVDRIEKKQKELEKEEKELKEFIEDVANDEDMAKSLNITYVEDADSDSDSEEEEEEGERDD